jgi:apolipoprotein N-acyltransferase
LGLALPVHRIILLEGARRMLVASLAGAAAALAMAPFNLFPVLAISFPVLIWLLDGAGPGRAGAKAAAWIGFSFGFGYFLAGLWWIGSAFLVDGDAYAWMLPFAVVGLPLLLAAFSALGCFLAWTMWSDGPGRLFALALGLGGAEWLRGRVLTGFPWNDFGYALADHSVLGQAASVIGVEGLTPIAVLVFSAPALLADPPERARWRWLFAAAAVLAVLALFGAWRLSTPLPQAPGTTLRIMQPNVPQDAKFRPSAGPEIMARYLALSEGRLGNARTGLEGVDLLIWPESAFPFLIGRTPEALAQIGGLLPSGTVLLTGAARREDIEDGDGRRFFNSLHAMADDGSIIATYDKVHLVPFGEYLPFQSALEAMGIRQLTRLPGGFSAGDEPRTISVPVRGAPKIAPLICYEAIFPTGMIDSASRPSVLINVTNDAWFGDTPGPRQHLAQSRARAVEQGLPLLRSANTGISAIIDPYGRVLASVPLGTAGVLDGAVPASLPPTLYSRYGILAVLLVYIATIVGLLITRRRV